MADLHQARAALGARLRGLRRDAGLSGKDFASRLNWPPSKVSKIETGQQGPSVDDLTAWTQALERGEDLDDLVDQVRALESATWSAPVTEAVRHRCIEEKFWCRRDA